VFASSVFNGDASDGNGRIHYRIFSVLNRLYPTHAAHFRFNDTLEVYDAGWAEQGSVGRQSTPKLTRLTIPPDERIIEESYFDEFTGRREMSSGEGFRPGVPPDATSLKLVKASSFCAVDSLSALPSSNP
jgi:hypothetical protein